MSLKNKEIESALRWRLDRKKGKLNCLLIASKQKLKWYPKFHSQNSECFTIKFIC